MHRVSYGYRSSYHRGTASGDTAHCPRMNNWRTGNDYHGYRAVRRRRIQFLAAESSASSYRDPHSNANIHIYGNSNNHDDRSWDNRPGTSVQSAPTRRPDFSSVLTVKYVDLKVSENGHGHHTDRYEISERWQRSPKLVIRRGQPFQMELALSKEFDAKVDDLKLIFEAGDDPSSINGTYVEIILSDKDLPKQWGAKILSNKGTHLTVEVFTPPDLYVGKWDFSVQVVKVDDTNVDVFKYEHDDPIYVIFNPWCEDDAVYMSEEILLNEYILNETGYLYTGTQNSISEKPWNFGQFDSVILDTAMYLLDESGLKWEVRGNPTLVVRKLSALINSQDDNGVLTGNWSGNYSQGRSPLSWTGSVKILEKFWNTKRPVKYGQCWVFSGVSTTVCRALGIPTRSVTNFVSAHDTDGSVTIDSIFDVDGNPVDSSRDSVWNFHVWNEAWMARPDLPKGFGGWQAFDATPQEASDGVYCCGPASVQAIHQGDVHLPYDGIFLFAEVNADRMSWQANYQGKLECIDCRKHEIGKNISTKTANKPSREDVTSLYKPKEGSKEERETVLRANQMGSNRPDLYEKKNLEDVEFTVEHDSVNTWIGGDFEAKLHMRNRSRDTKTVSGRVAVSSQYYTGQLADKLKVQHISRITLGAGQEMRVPIHVKYAEYDGKLKDCCMLDMSSFAQVYETGQRYTDKQSFRLRKPHLTLKSPSEVTAGSEFTVEASFTNPLASALTKCFVEVDGLSRPLKFRLGNVAPKGTFVANLPIVPKRAGETRLIVIFNSEQLEDVNASLPVIIR